MWKHSWIHKPCLKQQVHLGVFTRASDSKPAFHGRDNWELYTAVYTSIISTIKSGQISPIYNLTAHYMNLYGCDFPCFNYPGCCFGHLGRDILASSFTTSIKKYSARKSNIYKDLFQTAVYPKA